MQRARGVSPLLVALLFTLSFITSACGGNAQLQQRATQQKTQLDQTLQSGQKSGVPSSVLQPIIKQEQQISSTGTPFNLFNEQPINDYYSNLSTRYTQLNTQAQTSIAAYTAQVQAQAQRDLQNFQSSLTQARALKLPIQTFSQDFSQDQQQLAAAKYPKDYIQLSNKVRVSRQTLDMMRDAAQQLSAFNKTIQQMQQARLDVTAMLTQYQDDQQALNAVTKPDDVQSLNILINSQYQQAVVNTTLAIPYVTSAKIDEFQQKVSQLKTYGGNVSGYQKRLDADRAAMNKARTLQDFQAFSQQVNADIATMHNDLVQNEAAYLVKQFHQEVASWGKAHPFYNKFDGKNYMLDTGYMDAGIGSDLDRDLGWSYTPDDFSAMVDEANNALFNLRQLEADYNDKTPYNQVHAADIQMINHYNLHKGQLLMVSLVEQAMRLYQDGKLVSSFLVTTGRAELPAVPGVWPVLDRKSPTTFKSPEPPGSPYWYPDTPIHYAILYHWGGYFVHDSWWRVDYGPGTQYPHADSGGDTIFAGNGSHGCVNMQEQQAAWVYSHTDWNTLIVIY